MEAAFNGHFIINTILSQRIKKWQMTFDIFKKSLGKEKVPDGIHTLLHALWHDAKGNWTEAHNLAQEIATKEGSWVHAYLHRKEGDVSNAAYWYRKAEKQLPVTSIDEEWEELVEALLK